MEFKQQKSWVKHADFILLDLICLQLAFLFAYWIRHGMESNPYTVSIYRNEGLVLVLIQLLVAIFTKNFKNVLRRGFYKEFRATFGQVMMVTLFSTFYLFVVKEDGYSRITMALTGVLYLAMSYPVRLIWKAIIKARFHYKERKCSLLIITTTERAREAIKTVENRNYHDYALTGLVLMDNPAAGTQLYGVDVVANAANVVSYVCRSWVDELYIDVDRRHHLPQEMLDAFNEMGVTVHIKLQGLENPYHRVQYVEKMLGVTVMTFAVNDISPTGMFVKRLMDILGALVGCVITLILMLIIGPWIKIASPGAPIIFAQKRVGLNGKYFKMYKFRSMYPDAEERKKELMAQNEVSDGMMFKLENDPRIIKGVGNFIRKTSIDEFPQFFNVLKGDMSLVGTRPPTIDEWEKYKLHHRVRMSMRPGITGMWQVSGRSDIKEFEKVVKLDAEYIANWNVGLDIKIIFMTIAQVFKGKGAR